MMHLFRSFNLVIYQMVFLWTCLLPQQILAAQDFSQDTHIQDLLRQMLFLSLGITSVFSSVRLLANSSQLGRRSLCLQLWKGPSSSRYGNQPLFGRFSFPMGHIQPGLLFRFNNLIRLSDWDNFIQESWTDAILTSLFAFSLIRVHHLFCHPSCVICQLVCVFKPYQNTFTYLFYDFRSRSLCYIPRHIAISSINLIVYGPSI